MNPLQFSGHVVIKAPGDVMERHSIGKLLKDLRRKHDMDCSDDRTTCFSNSNKNPAKDKILTQFAKDHRLDYYHEKDDFNQHPLPDQWCSNESTLSPKYRREFSWTFKQKEVIAKALAKWGL